MNRFAIIVTFHLKPGKADAFKPLILANAAASVQNEDECFQFHVTQQEKNPDVFVLYEVYSNASSIEKHKAQPHFKKFMSESKPLIDRYTIEPLTVLNPSNLKT